MPGTTAVYGLPYLELTDAPDIAGATEDLAEATETALQTVSGQVAAVPKVKAGELNVSFSSANNNSRAVGFGTTFTTPPAVAVNINTGDGSAASWVARAYLITTTGFQLLVFSANGSNSAWSNIPVQWIAVAK